MFFIYVSTDNTDGAKTEDLKRTNGEFNAIVNFISKTYFSKLKQKGANGIKIFLIDSQDKESLSAPLKGVYPFAMCYLNFGFMEYLRGSSLKRKSMILEVIKKGVLKTASFMNWEPHVFQEIFEQIDNLKLEYKYVLNKPLTFKKAGDKAYLESIIETEFSRFFIVIQKSNGALERKEFLTLNTFYNISSFESNRIISEMKWEDANTVVVLGKKGHLERIRFEYKVDTRDLTRSFNLDDGVNETEFMEEFDLATTIEGDKLQMMVNDEGSNKWHLYL